MAVKAQELLSRRSVDELRAYGKNILEHKDKFLPVYVMSGLAEIPGHDGFFRVPVRTIMKGIHDLDAICRETFGEGLNSCENPPIDVSTDVLSALVCMEAEMMAETGATGVDYYVRLPVNTKAYEYYMKSGQTFRMVEIRGRLAEMVREAIHAESKRPTVFAKRERDAFASLINKYQSMRDDAEEDLKKDPMNNAARCEVAIRSADGAIMALREAAEAVGLVAWCDTAIDFEDGRTCEDACIKPRRFIWRIV